MQSLPNFCAPESQSTDHKDLVAGAPPWAPCRNLDPGSAYVRTWIRLANSGAILSEPGLGNPEQRGVVPGIWLSANFGAILPEPGSKLSWYTGSVATAR